MQDLQTANYRRCWGSCQGLALAIPLGILIIFTPICCCFSCIRIIRKWWKSRRHPVPAAQPIRNRNTENQKIKVQGNLLNMPTLTAPLVVAMVDELPNYEDVNGADLPKYENVET